MLLTGSEDEILDKLWTMDPSELPPLESEIVKLLGRRSVLVRLEAVRALWKIGPQTAGILRSRIQDEKNEVVLSEIVEVLGSFEDDESEELLKELTLHSKSKIVRTHAAFALGEIMAGQADDFLFSRANADPSRRVRASIAAYLAGVDYLEALPIVNQVLHSKDPVVRMRVANALKSSNPCENRPELLRLLKAALRRETTRGGGVDLREAIASLEAPSE